MSIIKKTIIDQIEITRAGHIQVRIGLLMIENSNEIDCKWHRLTINPGGDVDSQMAAVNAYLVQMGKVPVTDAEIVKIKAHAQAAWEGRIE